MATPNVLIGGINVETGSLFISDIIHHHLALGVILLLATHLNQNSSFEIGHHYSMEEYSYLYNWESQLSVNLAILGTLTIVVAHHIYAIPPYNYISLDYSTVISLFTHHIWIGGFCIVGAATHASITIIRSVATVGLLDRLIFHRDIIIYQLNYVCLFLGFHSFGLYIHNDTLSALGTESLFSDHSISIQPIFAQLIQH